MSSIEAIDLRLKENKIFTPRQNQILESLVAGLNSHEIEKKLQIAPKTLEHHINGSSSVEAGAHTRAELGIYGVVKFTYDVRPKNRGELLVILFRAGLVVNANNSF